MVFKNIYVLMICTKVASALEGLRMEIDHEPWAQQTIVRATLTVAPADVYYMLCLSDMG